jgi:hypothetical protein
MTDEELVMSWAARNLTTVGVVAESGVDEPRVALVPKAAERPVEFLHDVLDSAVDRGRAAAWASAFVSAVLDALWPPCARFFQSPYS